MKKKLLNIIKFIIAIYIVLCGFLYFFQEGLIFFPQKLSVDYKFEFDQEFEEISIKSSDGKTLNGLLFKSDSTRGLIFYLHGNSGSLRSWGNVAKTYTDLNYDVFILDYRGFGKSEGTINGQEQLFEDNQTAYNQIKKDYKEQNIIILGYSIGTGMASKLASENKPEQLILQAPYYSLIDVMKQKFSLIPTFILKYKFETNNYLKKCKMPITIFHGDQDNVIYYKSSVKLKNEFTSQIELITLEGQGHNGITDNKKYKSRLKVLLNKNDFPLNNLIINRDSVNNFISKPFDLYNFKKSKDGSLSGGGGFQKYHYQPDFNTIGYRFFMFAPKKTNFIVDGKKMRHSKVGYLGNSKKNTSLMEDGLTIKTKQPIINTKTKQLFG